MNAPRTKSLSRHGRVSDVKVAVDPARKKRYEKLATVIARSARNEARGFDAYWEAVGEVLDASLYVVGGYETADAYCRTVLQQSPRTVGRMVRVARHASPDEEAHYGTAVLDTAIAYLEAAGGSTLEANVPIHWKSVRIPVVRKGRTSRLPLDEVSLAELRIAVRSVGRKKGTARKRTHPAEQAIADALARDKSLAGIAVRVSDGSVKLGAVPLYALPALVKALRTVKAAALVK